MALEHTTSGYYEGLTLLDLEKIIMWELGQVTGLEISYNRFPQWLIRQKLNNRQNYFVCESQCLKKMALILCKEGYRQYKAPINCMDNGIIAAKYYSASTSYEELKVVDLDYMNTKMKGYLTDDDSDPEYIFMGDSYGNIPMIEVHPAPDADGTSYSADDDTGITIGGDIPGATNNITGQATGGSDTTLEDSSVDDFEDLGVVAGISVQNVTDGSAGVVLSISTNTITLASALTGGTANSFSAGDSYEILLGEYGVLVDWENDDRYIFGSEVGLLANITVPAGNIRLDFVPYPMTFPSSGNNDQYPEIPKLYHHDFAMGVVADLLKTFNETTKEFKRAEHYEAIYQLALSKAAGRSKNRPFQNKPVNFRPRLR